MQRCICVYSASGTPQNPAYAQTAQELGEGIAQRGYGLCYGGGMLGLMGITARAVHGVNGGRVVGVIPTALNQPGITYENCDELIVTHTMRERKQVMDDRSIAFIALPGGFGTMEELLEVITLKQLRYHNKAVVILNVDGFYDALVQQFERCIAQGMAKPSSRALYYVAHSAKDALDYIDAYTPTKIEDKLPVKISSPE